MEDEPYMEIEEQESPSEPIVFISLEKPVKPLTFQERVKRLQEDAAEIEKELTTLRPSTNCLAEMNEYVSQAGRLCKSQGVPDSDLTLPQQVRRRMAEALTHVLPTSESVTYTLQRAIPEDFSAETYISKVRDLNVRVTALEAVLGRWQPSYGYSTVEDAISRLKSQLNSLNHGKLELVNRHLEELNSEFDLLQSQIDHLNTGDDKLIEDLYKSLCLCYEYHIALPIILARLESLKSVHEEGSWFNQRLQELNEKFDKIKRKLTDIDLPQVFAEWLGFKKLAKEVLSA